MSSALKQRHADVFNQAAPGANTNILAASVTPVVAGSKFQVTIVLGTGSIVDVRETQGATAFSHSLNAGVALAAGAIYYMEFAVSRLSTYNFRVQTDGVIRRLIVDEVALG